MAQEFKYYAFISYNSQDMVWGRRLQKKLEDYKMPATLCRERGWKRKPLSPIFFAPTDIQPGGLSAELQERIAASRHLIVVCSPNSAKSKWVGKEIAFFHTLGRPENLHFFIVDGTPHSGNPATECINPVVEELGIPEILGVNVNEKIYKVPFLNRERAYIQLVSKLLGVDFSTIWNRHKMRLIQYAAAWTLGIILVMAAILGAWFLNQPSDVSVQLKESTTLNDYLPPITDAVVTLTLDNDTLTDTLHVSSGQVVFANVPRKYIGQQARIMVRCTNFLDVDTLVSLDKSMTLGIRRDPVPFGEIRVKLWNPSREQFVAGGAVAIAGHEVVSDAQGRIKLSIPLVHQRKAYPVTSRLPLMTDTIFMPCGDDDVVLVNN